MIVRQVSLLVLACAASATCLAGEGGGCAAPAQASSPPAEAVQVPDYAAAADDAPDPEEAAAEQAWATYVNSVFDALAASADPHDWALASLIRSDDPDHPRDGASLAARAAAALPDDALVQWIAAMADPTHGDKALASPAERALQRLEPENAAVWQLELSRAMRAGDDAAADRALARMATSSRMSVHWNDIGKALAAAYSRYPVPSELARTMFKDPASEANSADIAAWMTTAAFALPSFQHLVSACRLDPATGRNAVRAADCAATGRLFAGRGDTLIANVLGFAVLRVSRTYTDADVASARELGWLRSQWELALQGDDDVFYGFALTRYWYETGSETGAMRRMLEEHGVSLAVPDGWVDRASPFSAERLEADAKYLREHASGQGT
ncbi:MAG TPA: hypothetical protein VFB32_10430 [Rudaea sp.]|nr:hypothetical protein [Rudaea sp.]